MLPMSTTKALERTLLGAPLLAALLAGGCGAPNPSNNERVMAQMQAAPDPPSRGVEVDSHPPARPGEVRLFTWQKRTLETGETQLVVYGKGLGDASALTVGEEQLAVTSERDGALLVAPWPKQATADVPILVTVGELQLELPERFSLRKPDGLPTIESVFYTRERRRSPKARGREMDTIRFQFTLSGYEQLDMPLNVFFGDHAVPADQIEDHPDRMTGWVYDIKALRNGQPVTVDFGQGLRVMATERFMIPR